MGPGTNPGVVARDAKPSADDLLGPAPNPPVDDLLDAEDFLGQPSADDILGPPPPEARPMEMGSAKGGPSAAERFLDQGPIGRILDAAGEGLSAGWGARDLGLSPESEKALREHGLMPDYTNRDWALPFQAFNAAIIRPAAAGLDAVMRGATALTYGAARAVGQTAQELGESEAEANRLTRDMVMIADTLAVVSGSGPVSGRARSARTARTAEAEAHPGAVVAEAPKPAETPKPITPHDPLPVEPVALDKVGNINLDRIRAPEDVKSIIDELAEANAGHIDARRGVITFEQTQDLADALGMSHADLMKRKIGEAFNAEQITAARNLGVQAATAVKEAQRKASETMAPADILAYQEAKLRALTVVEQVSGIGAEAGRALSAHRIMAQATREAKDLAEAVKKIEGSGVDIATELKMIGELDTPAKVNKYLRESQKAKTSDMVLEAWINALLSNFVTHSANVIGNTLTSIMRVPETALAAGIGRVRTAITGSQDRVVLGEANARLYGTVASMREGVLVAAKTFKTEIPSSAATKLEQARPRAIPSAEVEILGHTMEIGGKQVRFFGRLLMAEDELFRTLAMRSEIHAQAYRTAAREGLEGDAFAARMADLIENPTEDMLKAARKNADYQTFQSELGKIGKSVQGLSNSHPAFKVIMPFVRTPINLLKYANERTPFGLLSKEVRDNIAKGGASADEQLARIATGTSIIGGAAALAINGLISGGGPVDPEKRALMFAQGWAPYSIKIGDTWYSYSRLEPIAMILGATADAVEFAKASQADDADVEKIITMLVGAATKNTLSKTWTRGVSDAVRAAFDPERYGEGYVERLAGTLVPAGIAQLARMQDPVLRDAQGALDALRARIPGLSEGVAAKRDIWGNKIELQGALGPDLLSPIYTSRVKNDPLAKALQDAQVWVAQPDRHIQANGVRVELTDAQYERLQVYAGANLRMMLQPAVNAPNFSTAPLYARQQLLTRIKDRSREQARTAILMENPDLLRQLADKRQKAMQK